MTLATRMWLLGALLPSVVMALVLLGADRLFHLALDGSLDRALLAQAAIESVSLFDGPNGEAHLHMATSPLAESVRPFAPQGELFGPDGALVTRYPERSAPYSHDPVTMGEPGAAPVLETREHQGRRERTLTVTVAATGKHEPHTLRLIADLAQFDAASAAFHWLATGSVLVMAFVLFLVQGLQGRVLRQRLLRLAEHVQAIRAGDLERVLLRDRRRDEVSQLGEVLNQATEALRAARDSKARLVAEAAHELRTPLTVMRTGLDLALRREREPDELKSALRDAREEVDRLAHMASELLDMACVAHDAEPREPQDVIAIVRASVEAVRAVARERGVRVELHGPPELIASVRPHALRRAVDNLVSNALKHARESIAVRVASFQGGCRVTVHDDGAGILEAERELVFEPFHRVPGSPPGAGLGLSIVREVAAVHDGRAYVGTQVGGAELVMELGQAPAAPASAGD